MTPTSLTIDPLTLTLIFIILSALVGMFLRGRARDACLRDFSGSPVTVERVAGAPVYGRLHVEATGLELLYAAPHADEQGHVETSYLFYKHEFANIQSMARYLDELSVAQQHARGCELKRTWHPSWLRRTRRRLRNLSNTLRDSVADIANLVVGRAKTTRMGGSLLGQQGKYVTKIQQGVLGATATAYEPLLERHIGHKVVLEMARNNQIEEFCGVLKEYTAEFIEIMDVEYLGVEPGATPRRADLIVPRRCGVVRHLAESRQRSPHGEPIP